MPDQTIVSAVQTLDAELLSRFHAVQLPELCRQNDLTPG